MREPTLIQKAACYAALLFVLWIAAMVGQAQSSGAGYQPCSLTDGCDETPVDGEDDE